MNVYCNLRNIYSLTLIFLILFVAMFYLIKLKSSITDGKAHHIPSHHSVEEDASVNEPSEKAFKKEAHKSLLLELQTALTPKQLEKHCHNKWFRYPSKLEYNLLREDNKKYFSQEQQDVFIDRYFNHKENGIFLEVGATNGVHLSNTLFFERERNWSGILIEPNNKFYNQLVTVNRKSYTINSCLSLDNKIDIVKFLPAEMIGGVETGFEKTMKERASREFPNTSCCSCEKYFLLSSLNKLYSNFNGTLRSPIKKSKIDGGLTDEVYI